MRSQIARASPGPPEHGRAALGTHYLQGSICGEMPGDKLWAVAPPRPIGRAARRYFRRSLGGAWGSSGVGRLPRCRGAIARQLASADEPLAGFSRTRMSGSWRLTRVSVALAKPSCWERAAVPAPGDEARQGWLPDEAVVWVLPRDSNNMHTGVLRDLERVWGA